MPRKKFKKNNRELKSIAFHILNRVGNFLEKTESIPDFFDEEIDLNDEKLNEIIMAICKIGKSWLRHQWEDLYHGRKPPLENKRLFADTSSPKL